MKTGGRKKGKRKRKRDRIQRQTNAKINPLRANGTVEPQRGKRRASPKLPMALRGNLTADFDS